MRTYNHHFVREKKTGKAQNDAETHHIETQGKGLMPSSASLAAISGSEDSSSWLRTNAIVGRVQSN
jgi:hypothetical protein